MALDGARGGEVGGERLPRAARITTSDEIRSLFRRGKRRKTRHLDVFISASPVSRSRLGLVVPKPRGKGGGGGQRNGGAAVRRNRLKRRLREIGRRIVLTRLDGAGMALDLLIRARQEAYDAGYGELRDELGELTEGLCSGGF